MIWSMNRILISVLLMLLSGTLALSSQNYNMLLLGDIHYDRLEDHDMEWLATRGDNLRQVTKEYTVWTRENWPVFSATLGAINGVDAVVQLGDLSEGLAGTPDKAVKMARRAISALDSIGFRVPVVMVKGNHDITGPGAREAFDEVYLPAMGRLSGRREGLSRATYATQLSPEVVVVAFDPWDKKATPALLDSLLSSSDASYKFVALHEPVIPVNYRCWHVFRKKPAVREELIRVLSSHNAIVLSAHLHKNGVVSRKTPFGRITQIMANSVVRSLDIPADLNIRNRYDTDIVSSRPDWEPDSYTQRVQWISDEMKDVDFYSYFDLPGYAILSIVDGRIFLSYYAGSTTVPLVSYDISDIHKK